MLFCSELCFCSWLLPFEKLLWWSPDVPEMQKSVGTTVIAAGLATVSRPIRKPCACTYIHTHVYLGQKSGLQVFHWTSLVLYLLSLTMRNLTLNDSRRGSHLFAISHDRQQFQNDHTNATISICVCVLLSLEDLPWTIGSSGIGF